MGDEELDALRKRRMMELQAESQASAEQEAYAQMEEEKMRAQRDAILRQIFTPEARERLSTIRLAKPEFAQQVEDQMIILAQSGRIPLPVTDEFLKSLLQEVQGRKREITIKRV